jgi:protein SERAC1
MSRKSSQSLDTTTDEAPDAQATGSFWPRDFLPRAFPKARIMVFGYDTKITKYMSAATNRNGVYQHSKDLLFTLIGNRKDDKARQRPLIFIAHSLGGIIVKEMLAISSGSDETARSILCCTRSIIFLGTPHRGSPDLASLGESARVLISALRMGTNSAILDALGLKTTDLERAQDSFSNLWNKHDIQVKTFREGLGLTGVNFGALGNKVVPDYSSLIGDPRERAETIQANHMDMCRFESNHDPGYKQVIQEIGQVFDALERTNNLDVQPPRLLNLVHRPASGHAPGNKQSLNPIETSHLGALPFPGMNSRIGSIEEPSRGTCEWLFSHETYLDWLQAKQNDRYKGLLWLKGKPGAGKSTLIREAYARALRNKETSDYWLAAFFFNAKGEVLERTPLGLFRSLLHQLLPHCLQLYESFSTTTATHLMHSLNENHPSSWSLQDCDRLLRTVLTIKHPKRIIIFIDALDECDPHEIEAQAEFWRDVTLSAYMAGIQLNVCLSSRKFPYVGLNDCAEIDMEHYIAQDIALYIDGKLSLRMNLTEREAQILRETLLVKSCGTFLWIKLVLRDLLRGHDKGSGIRTLLRKLESMPKELGEVYAKLLADIEPAKMPATLRLFQWAILATTPLRLHEWHHIEAFLEDPSPRSLSDWYEALNGSDAEKDNPDDERFVKRLVDMSKGLLEVTCTTSESLDHDSDRMSVHAGAGSLDLEHGSSRMVQVIHESVRDFFLNHNGFAILSNDHIHGYLVENAVINGHLSIIGVCLDYLNISELDVLVQARTRANARLNSKSNNRKKKRRCTNSHLDREDGNNALGSPLTLPPTLLPIRREEQPSSRQNFTELYGRHNQLTTEYTTLEPDKSLKRSASIASFGSAASHDSHGGRWSPSVWRSSDTQMVSDSSAKSLSKRRLTEHSTFMSSSNLSKYSSSSAGIDVDVWRRTAQANPRPSTSLTMSSGEGSVSSFSGKSNVLGAFPALMSYATSQVFVHARLIGDDPKGLDKQLFTHVMQKMMSSWPRLLALKEDIAHDTELLYTLADRGLGLWIPGIAALDLQAPARAVLQAIEKKHLDAFKLLLTNIGYRLVDEKNSHISVLHSLSQMGDVSFLEYFLESTTAWQTQRRDLPPYMPFLDAKDEKARSALQIAVMAGNTLTARALLRRGVDVNAFNGDGRTALHTATLNMHKRTAASPEEALRNMPVGANCTMVKLLIEYGADVTLRERPAIGIGRTPLHNICCTRPAGCKSTGPGNKSSMFVGATTLPSPCPWADASVADIDLSQPPGSIPSSRCAIVALMSTPQAQPQRRLFTWQRSGKIMQS